MVKAIAYAAVMLCLCFCNTVQAERLFQLGDCVRTNSEYKEISGQKVTGEVLEETLDGVVVIYDPKSKRQIYINRQYLELGPSCEFSIEMTTGIETK